MEPTLHDGDRFILDKTAYGLFLPFSEEAAIQWDEPERGDVVVLSGHDRIDIIKRVVGIPGDTVAIINDHLSINGEAVRRTPRGQCMELSPSSIGDSPPCTEEAIGNRSYLTLGRETSMPSIAPLEVPPGHVFVLSDHRDRSNDSRFFGPVPVTRVKGRALFIYQGHDVLGAVR